MDFNLLKNDTNHLIYMFKDIGKSIELSNFDMNKQEYLKVKFFYPFNDYQHHNLIEEL